MKNKKNLIYIGIAILLLIIMLVVVLIPSNKNNKVVYDCTLIKDSKQKTTFNYIYTKENDDITIDSTITMEINDKIMLNNAETVLTLKYPFAKIKKSSNRLVLTMTETRSKDKFDFDAAIQKMLDGGFDCDKK